MNISQNSNLKSQNYNSNLKSSDVKVRAYKFSLEIIKFVNGLPNKRAFWSIGDQLLRSATSIGANIMEAQASSSKREFIKYYQIALKSSNETKYWLYLLRDSYDILKSKCDDLIKDVIEISNMLGSSVLTMKGKKKF